MGDTLYLGAAQSLKCKLLLWYDSRDYKSLLVWVRKFNSKKANPRQVGLCEASMFVRKKAEANG
jgi:hypothetical protein